ncbi:tetratricopeptide repeat protein [Gloeobacter violaceus]|uniref:Gll1119 protein n=1 Tax=Gloeobacter violaceus (strain ATCC 29082 / PCC 7421) TaxID=251221 RepID=Q7NLK4_GLOVI|nr:tetratricopeptide repeat protein [Gloeobacter violaceus]BAC89060.1 gll1119 [Gloeobacter violaceus PCC 7421]
MVKQPLRYNPGFVDDEELNRYFVIRTHILTLIKETLHDNINSSNQNILIVGPRGSGKTMLVRRVASEIRSNPDLSSHWYPIVFAEESYRVTSPGEFWLEALFYVGEQTQEQRWQQAYEDLKSEMDNKRLRDRALTQLMDFADEQRKRLVLIVENLNMLLGEQLKAGDDWDLRHTMQTENRLMLLGTATQQFEAIKNIGRAWFEFFVIYKLEPLNTQECQMLWIVITGENISIEHIRPLQILTGGSPRLLSILAGFAKHLSFKELMSNLAQLIDNYTPYFKSQLDSLAPSERKVFVALLEQWDPANASEIAKAARMNTSTVSALLGRLVNRGAVTVNRESGHKKLYQAAERLFNIYYLMRQQSHPSRRVRAVVDFMIQFYKDESLVTTVVKLAEEACKLDPEDRQYHYWAYQEIIKLTSNPMIRAKLIISTPSDFTSNSVFPENIRKELYDEKIKVMEIMLKQIIQNEPENFTAMLALSLLLVLRGDSEEAEQLCRRAIQLEPANHIAWIVLGRIMVKSKRYAQAEKSLRTSIELNPYSAVAWFELGDLLERQLRMQESELAYDNAIEHSKLEDRWEVVYGMADIFCMRNKWVHGLGLLSSLITRVASDRDVLQAVSKFVVTAAAAGYTREVLELIVESNVREVLQPLEAGLRMHLNEQPLFAQEINEIGQDVLRRIREEQAMIAR